VRNRIISLVVGSVMVMALCVATAAAFTKTVTIKVEGMKCAKCSSSVSKALKATEGVEDATVSSDKARPSSSMTIRKRMKPSCAKLSTALVSRRLQSRDNNRQLVPVFQCGVPLIGTPILLTGVAPEQKS